MGATTTPRPRVPLVADVQTRDGNTFIRRLLGQTKIQSSHRNFIIVSLHVDITTRTNNVKWYHNIDLLEVLHLVLHLREYLFIPTFIIIDIQFLLRIVHTDHNHYEVRVEINGSVKPIAIQVELGVGVDAHPGRPKIGTRRRTINQVLEDGGVITPIEFPVLPFVLLLVLRVASYYRVSQASYPFERRDMLQ
jgi:hypothetical protein